MHNYGGRGIIVNVMRTTVVIPDDLKRKARRVADERGVSFSELVREALEQTLRNERPKARSFGLGASGKKGIARRASELYRPDPWRS